MRFVRLFACVAAVLCVGAFAGAAGSATGAPTGLHAFLLRADEPARTSFPRTPSFAWNPVAAADHYEFQLSLSTTFRDNSVVWASLSLHDPVVAPPVALPWISGNPHSLYARVRAVVGGLATPWSSAFGFDMAPPAPPVPLPSYPGLLRWTPVEGAVKYEVWFVDANNKHVFTTTNVLDEREFYAFHQTQNWMGTVRWRIRAWRTDPMADQGINKLPATKWGAWSPVYSSSNPAYADGPIKLLGTVSDVFSNGSAASPAHRLMPAFLWAGNQTAGGEAAELYRVYVFSDRQCLNPVYAGPAVASPAYAPRPFGSIAMPDSAAGIQAARSTYLGNGSEPTASTFAGDPVDVNEFQSGATPTTAPPGIPGADTSSSPTAAPAAGPGLKFPDQVGAPIDLWDTEWPQSGYYWTVVPVAVQAPDQLSTNVAGAGGASGGTTLPVASSEGFRVGDIVTVGVAPALESVTVAGVGPGALTLAAKLVATHLAGEPVTRSTGTFEYRDLELAQDVCAAGRVLRFGKDSEPSLTASEDLFATGLSSTGRLTSARHTTRFYGRPLVSWTPALGAWSYEIQWSRTSKPFQALGASMTKATSYVLPLAPGTWYYRVRGFDYSLPTGSQQMSWSEPAMLVVSKPVFKVVHVGAAPKAPSKPKATAKKSATSGWVTRRGIGFSLALPATWQSHAVKDSVVTFAYRHLGARGTDGTVSVLASAGRGTRSYAQWSADLVASLQRSTGVSAKAALVTLPAGKAVLLTAGFSVSGEKLRMLQYVVAAGPAAYVVTFEAVPSAYAGLAPVFTKAIESFRFG